MSVSVRVGPCSSVKGGSVPEEDPLIPKHGGYRRLKTFQLARLIYDVTFQFCEKYMEEHDRLKPQMVHAARSCVQNIAEGSQTSGTSKKSELKLTGVGRASLEELLLDYEDFLRQRKLEKWIPSHPALTRFKAKRCATLEDVRAWVKEERALSVSVGVRPCSSVILVANAALSLINLCSHLLDKQLAAQSKAFVNEGGFTERLYRTRKNTSKRD